MNPNQTKTGYNRLIFESSLYLQQHARNPVNWYPWSPEAFEEARKTDKPIFLSIGYSACHWCHVMERESFENPDTAALLNDRFICIKVDREERPDIDGIYMQAVQMMTGSGGWPMSVWLDHDLKPFYGGTYFPPQDRYQLPSFSRVLSALSEMWNTNRSELLKSAAGLTAELIPAAGPGPAGVLPAPQILHQAAKKLASSVDPVYGGFGTAPKFPSVMALQVLHRASLFFNDPAAKTAFCRTLDSMAAGGIYDHIGGGFARYSVDKEWHVPHFEKMLYDNALLIQVYTEAWQSYQTPLYRDVAEQTATFILREMTNPNGGFYSAFDADSEGREGAFYTWTAAEFDQVTHPHSEVMRAWFDVSDEGNWEHSSILRRIVSAQDIQNRFGLTAEQLADLLKSESAKLLLYRQRRVPPALDRKILTSWNSLMISALSKAGFAFDRPEFIEAAEKAAVRILTDQDKSGVLFRVFNEGEVKIPGFAEDYGNFLLALTDLGQATGNPDWFLRAEKLANRMIAEFYDRESGGFFQSRENRQELIVRLKDWYDNAEPSGNSSGVRAMMILGRLTGNRNFTDLAEQTVKSAADLIRNYPQACGWLAIAALDLAVNPADFIIIRGEEEPADWIQAARTRFLPGSLVLISKQSDVLPVLSGKMTAGGSAALYVCRNQVCYPPVTKAEDWS
ncbi:MAG: thioredoxin domain-containing protein [Bacteroidetes bacterium]|nr:thioredoxin domain-containing protein [Bacteroidota bacterium]